MRFLKKTALALLTVSLVAVTVVWGAANVSAAKVIASGTCGENAEWTFCDDGCLVISGTGAMEDYKMSLPAVPWYGYKDAIETIVIEDGITSISGNAFHGCAVKTVSLADSVTEIGASAFFFCRQLEEITISENVELIGADAFARCISLDKITVDEENPNYSNDEYGVLYNKDRTLFLQYPAGSTVTEYSIPDTVSEIPFYGFTDNVSIEKICIPASLSYIGRMAFVSCESLTSFETASDNPYFMADSEGVLFSKDGRTLVKYPEGKTETAYSIPNTVSLVGAYAFYGTVLESVSIPEGVKMLEWMAFASSRGLTEITIPSTVYSIGQSCFNGSYNIISVTILNPHMEFGNGAFSVMYPSFVMNGYTGSTAEKYAKDNQFAFVSLGKVPEELKQVLASGECGENVTWTLYITGELVISGEGAMTDWDRWTDPTPWDMKMDFIKSITVEKGITHIGNAAFFPCVNATSISLPSTLTSIGAMAFRNCEKVTEIVIPKTVTSIGNWAFGYCASLKELFIPDSVTKIGSAAFRDCSGLTKIILSTGITSIENSTFSFCTSLTTVALPKGITSIGNYAFSFCDSLNKMVIPENVSSLGIGVFGGCTSLSTVTVFSRNAVFNGDLFSSAQGTVSDVMMFGYKGSTTEAYANAYGYSFTALAEAYVPGDITGDREVNISDVLSLFRYSMMPDLYPVFYEGSMDFTGDDTVDISDAIHLFRHSMMPDLYPLF